MSRFLPSYRYHAERYTHNASHSGRGRRRAGCHSVTSFPIAPSPHPVSVASSPRAPAKMEQVPPAYPGRELQALAHQPRIRRPQSRAWALWPLSTSLAVSARAGGSRKDPGGWGVRGFACVCSRQRSNCNEANRSLVARLAVPQRYTSSPALPAYDRGDTSACPYDSDSVLVTATRAARPRATQPVPCPRYLGATIISTPILCVTPTLSSRRGDNNAGRHPVWGVVTSAGAEGCYLSLGREILLVVGRYRAQRLGFPCRSPHATGCLARGHLSPGKPFDDPLHWTSWE